MILLGDAWELNLCTHYSFPELQKFQQDIMHKTGANSGDDADMRKAIDEAIADLRRAIALRPDFGAAHTILGNALKNIGDLARGPGAERYHQIKDDGDAFELDDAPLLGLPEEIVAQLKRLEAGGVENVLFAAPGASVAHLRTFAEEIMPAFLGNPMGLAQV